MSAPGRTADADAATDGSALADGRALADIVAALADPPTAGPEALAQRRADLVGPSRPAARWVAELVAAGDRASLVRLYGETTALHEEFEELLGATTPPAVAARPGRPPVWTTPSTTTSPAPCTPCACWPDSGSPW